MNYTELESAITAGIGNPDTQLALLTTENFFVATKCLAKTYPQVFQALRDLEQINAEYLQLRTNLTAAPNSAAVFALWTPHALYLAKYGVEYEIVKAGLADVFRTIGYLDPDQAAADALEAEAIRITGTFNQPNLSAC